MVVTAVAVSGEIRREQYLQEYSPRTPGFALASQGCVGRAKSQSEPRRYWYRRRHPGDCSNLDHECRCLLSTRAK